MNDVQDTLAERGKNYGEFKNHAAISQNLKAVMRETPNWYKLRNSQREALEMIVHKIARALNGNSDFEDSWFDIAGYSTLIVNELTENK